VARRNVRFEREVELGEAPALAPRAQQRPHRLEGGRHGGTIPAARRRSITSGVIDRGALPGEHAGT
jgi:hypothetical protein